MYFCNPKNPKSIIQTDPNSFIIIPFSEDNDPNYKFRLDVIAENKSGARQTIDLKIDWHETKHNNLRDHVYSKGDENTDWLFNPFSINGRVEC